jgi:nicotinamide-nucleotide amidase
LRPRAAVVLTGSELVRGQRTDRNGPFLAHELVRLGFEPARLTIVGDDAAELETAFRQALDAELVITSGGLGPTHDDRTIELLARVTGRELVVDEGLRVEIESVSRAISKRFRRPYADFAPGIEKQATLPAGAVSLGRAPGPAERAEAAVERGARDGDDATPARSRAERARARGSRVRRDRVRRRARVRRGRR